MDWIRMRHDDWAFVSLTRHHFNDDLPGSDEIQDAKAIDAGHDPCIGNPADERNAMSDTVDEFKYKGVTVRHHLETDTYEVRGDMFLSRGEAYAYIDALEL